MIPIPAIDLRDGKVVRLLRGDFNAEKSYPEKPADVAARFTEEGATRIHVVDLDGALRGVPRNAGCVEQILRRVKTPVELGGGVRSLQIAERYFKMGVRWTVLGTKAALDRGFLREALREFGEKIIVGIDARDGFVATDGWTKVTDIPATDFVREIESLGTRTVIYTDISKDGALAGPNMGAVIALCESVKLDVIASGGVGTLDHVKKLAELKKQNLTGVIIGKALYENRLTLKDAIKTCLPSA